MALLLLFWPAGWGAAEEPVTEYAVKAAFLYNFSRFVTWPVPPGQPFVVGVLGENPFGDALESIAGKPVGGDRLAVRLLQSAEEIGACRILFVAASEERRLPEILRRTALLPVLTVSDMERFAQRGGIIGLRTVDNRIRLEINAAAAQRAGLAISSQLLRLATLVEAGS
jgi:hypothetical protein